MNVLPRAKKTGPALNAPGILPLAVLTVFSILFILGRPCCSRASERLLDFKSRIQVHQDGSMTVHETIQVICEGKQIKRGIFREFPTKYKDRYGNTVEVGFTVVKVIRDGRREPYHIQQAPNGKRVYIGQKEVLLKPGSYTYDIIYKTDRQLGFFRDFDELYWNVTGNGWSFVIDRARAVVELPPGAEIQDKAAYTGRVGEKGRDYTSGFDDSGSPVFTTSRPLMPGEGLTIAVAWPKGFVAEPTSLDKASYVLKDNRSVFWGLAGMLIVFAYYLLAWFRVGRDPAAETIVPLFAPPGGFSPAAVRYVTRMGFDDKSFAAAIVNLAVKGYLTIDQGHDDVFTLEKTANGKADLSRGEQRIMAELLSSRSSIRLKRSNHRTIQAAVAALKKSLKTEFEKTYFLLNSGYFAPGLILTILTLGVMILAARDAGPAAFMGLWLSIWTVGCFFLVLNALRAWKKTLQGGVKALRAAGAVGATLFALPFLAGEIFGLWALSSSLSPLAAPILPALIFINVLFYHLLKAPTLLGRRVMDKIEGFKLYLSVAEKERLNMLNPPDRTPELFERYLPYAMALNVENKWSEQFAGVLAAAAGGGEYRPAWCTGRSWTGMDGSALASTLGSAFAGAVSSASSAPGSSSGSGGGGSSGGGGGGGGGGGW